MSHPVGLSVILAIASIIISAFKWNTTPKHFPYWWDSHSHPIWWVPRWVGLLLLPVLIFLIPYIIHIFAERDSNIERQAQESKHAVSHVVAIPALFLFFVQNFVLLDSARSATQDFHPHLFGANVALWLLIWFGLNIRKVEYNHTIGIFSPWSLSGATAWDATHTHAGWVFIAAGVILLIISLVVPKGLVFYILLFVIWIGSYVYVFIYSYFVSGSERNEALLG